MEKLVRKFEWPEDDEACIKVYVSSDFKKLDTHNFLYNFDVKSFSKCNQSKELHERIIAALEEMKTEIDNIIQEIKKEQ